MVLGVPDPAVSQFFGALGHKHAARETLRRRLALADGCQIKNGEGKSHVGAGLSSALRRVAGRVAAGTLWTTTAAPGLFLRAAVGWRTSFVRQAGWVRGRTGAQQGPASRPGPAVLLGLLPYFSLKLALMVLPSADFIVSR